MAEVSNPRRFYQQTLSSTGAVSGGCGSSVDRFEEEEEEEEEEGPNLNLYAFDFDSVSRPKPPSLIPSNNNENFNFTTSEPDSGSQESESVRSDQNFFFYGSEEEDDDGHMNFVTDLFARRQGISNEQDDVEFGCRCLDEEPELVVLGLESECNRVDNPSMAMGGLRIADMESESDSEAVEVDSRVHGFDNRDGMDPNDDLGLPGLWDCPQFDTQSAGPSLNEEFEWEELNVRETLSSLIDRIEEISVLSDGQSSPFENGGAEEVEDDEENARNVEWQVLLAVNNLELAIGFDEYNVLLGELVEGEDSTIKGSPPAAKSVLENLPSVVLTVEDLTMNNMVCAVCKDEICVGMEVTRLPCCHHYHQDCIVPWLSIRNTCPLCRYELPTDDMDYERRKSRNDGGTGQGDDLQVRYNYQLLP